MTDIASDSARWLKLGLGRPAIAMIQGEPEQFREPLLYSCAHDQGYSAECGSRTPYLWNLIHLSREAAWYRERIVAQLREPLEDSDDFAQSFELAGRFAEQGYTDARRAMYQAVERENHPELIWCASDLIRLDGFEGFLYCLRRWKSFEGTESHVPWSFLNELEERDGKQVRMTVEAAEAQSPEVADFMRMVRDQESEGKKHRQQKREEEPLNYAAVKREIQLKGGQGTYFGNWANTADAEQIEVAAHDLLSEENESTLLGLLKLFARHRFPLPFARLIELVEANVTAEHFSMRELIAFFAVRALSLITDLEVRSLAMKLIQDPATVCKGAQLLENNYQPGDFSLLRRLMEQAADQEALHSLGFDLRSMAKAHPSEDAEPALLYLYEHGPCSLCRGGVVTRLTELNHLPAWMHIEFQFDCGSLR